MTSTQGDVNSNDLLDSRAEQEGGVRKRLFPNCFRCELPVEIEDYKRQLLYCPECRTAIRAEMRAEQEAQKLQIVQEEVRRMDWPDTIE